MASCSSKALTANNDHIHSVAYDHTPPPTTLASTEMSAYQHQRLQWKAPRRIPHLCPPRPWTRSPLPCSSCIRLPSPQQSLLEVRMMVRIMMFKLRYVCTLMIDLSWSQIAPSHYSNSMTNAVFINDKCGFYQWRKFTNTIVTKFLVLSKKHIDKPWAYATNCIT